MLDELMTANDVEFVRSAYRLVLRREADPGGQQTYVDLLRAGRDKAFVLRAIAESPEGKSVAANIPGLSQMLRWRRIGRFPLIGRLAAALHRLLLPTPDHDPEVAFRNQLIGMQRATLELANQLIGMQRATLELANQLTAVADDLQLRQSGMERALARLDRRRGEAKRLRS